MSQVYTEYINIGDSTDEFKWEKYYSDEKYALYRKEPNSIILDKNMNFRGIMVEDKIGNISILYLDEILKLSEGCNGIKFNWMESGDFDSTKTLRIIRHGDNAEFNFWANENHFLNIMIDQKLKHPLHIKYGQKGLKLKKIVYSSVQKVEATRVEKVTFCDEEVNHYYIERAEFSVLDEEGNEIDILYMSMEDILYNILIMRDTEHGVSRPFYEKSLFTMLGVSLYRGGIPYFRIGHNYLRLNQYNKNSEIYGLEIEQSTKNNAQIENWKNKMSVAGHIVECNSSTLLSIKDIGVKMSSDTIITLPGFSSINQSAFEETTISKIRITSPDTMIFPSLPCDSAGEYQFYNKDSNPVKIEYSFDKENKYYKTLLSKLYVNNLFNDEWIRETSEMYRYQVHMQIPLK